VHIEGRLPEPDAELVFDDGSEPGPVSPALQMADACLSADKLPLNKPQPVGRG
jgi:hypothetical protein